MAHEANRELRTTDKGLAIIKSCESCKLEAYLDTGKVPTIGWGHTANVKLGDTCAQEQADAWLRSDVSYAEGIVKKAVNVPLSQNRFDALVSFVYNIGPGHKGTSSGFVTLRDGSPSSLLRYINAEAWRNAGQEFLKWNKDNGVVLGGLVKRRIKEKDLFMGLA